MKRLACEMCGGTDLIKQDGVFVCQNCGMKYSVEDAKKMMIEGTVDVKGTVKVDTSGELENLYQIARRAKDDNNGENAAKYYDMILLKDPTSWEASFYVVYFKALECKIAQIRSAAISVSNCEKNVLMLIRDNVPEDEQADAVKEVMLRSLLIANMLANGAKSHYDEISPDIKNDYIQEYVNNVCAARDIMYTCGTQIDSIFQENTEIGKLAADAWKSGIEIHTRVLSYFADKSANEEIIMSYVKKIGKYDSEYTENYINSKQKKILEDELAILKEDLIKTEKDSPMSKSDMAIRSIVMGVGASLVLTIYMIVSSTDSILDTMLTGLMVALLMPGLFFIVLLITNAGKSSKQKENQEKIASLKSQIEAKQAEIDNLKM
ncbi:MAG TPA: TFIIB-type zinc finger domain-containing protein [Oscillospiraceae bacterium]|nr:TFIIB-type zinc finger domain-containing protein [Oscillospiraceae bacterium]